MKDGRLWTILYISRGLPLKLKRLKQELEAFQSESQALGCAINLLSEILSEALVLDEKVRDAMVLQDEVTYASEASLKD